MANPELGEIKRIFRPGLENIFAGIIIGLLLIGAGGGLVFLAAKGVIDGDGDLPFWVKKGPSWGLVILFGALGIGLMLCGLFLIRWIRSLTTLRVLVGQDGFVVSERNITEIFAWQEIQSVKETHLYERPPILKGAAKYALPKTMSKSFVVTRKDGVAYGFDGNAIKGHTKLAQMIRDETTKRNITWEIVEVHA